MMIDYRKYFILFVTVFLFFISGLIFFIFYRDILIVKFFWNKKNDTVISDSGKFLYVRKEVKLFYFKNDQIQFEIKKLIWFNKKSDILKHLVNSWLSFLQEERIIKKKVNLDSVSLDKTGQIVFFSFDRPLFETDWSIFNKWNFIESLLKTIRESGIKINEIYFLVNHKKMQDAHLDFYFPWPVSGFN
ncbi:MAG: hypothetical protein ABIF12_03325 [bacterium]